MGLVVSRSETPREMPPAPGVSFDDIANLPATIEPFDALLLTIADHALVPVTLSWAESLRDQPPPFRAVLHTSGSFDSEVLAPLRSVGIAIGSLHPLCAFPHVLPSADSCRFFAMDGDPEALTVARRLVAAWHGTAHQISGDRRVVYHLAASLAAGGVVTLLAAVAELMHRADLPDELLSGYLALLLGAVDVAAESAETDGPRALSTAITGPAARDDMETLERHRAALQTVCPDLLPTVEASWRETLRQTAPSGQGPAETREVAVPTAETGGSDRPRDTSRSA